MNARQMLVSFPNRTFICVPWAAKWALLDAFLLTVVAWNPNIARTVCEQGWRMTRAPLPASHFPASSMPCKPSLLQRSALASCKRTAIRAGLLAYIPSIRRRKIYFSQNLATAAAF